MKVSKHLLVVTTNRNRKLLYIIDDLREHFSKFGGIKYIYFKIEASTGHSRGYAFVVFKTMEGLENVSIPFGLINLIHTF